MDHPTAMALRDALWTATQLAGPPLLIVLGIGFTISLLQALTQIQEATLAFLPKVAAVGLALLALGPWMGGVMQAWAVPLFDQVVLLGGMP